MNRARPSAAATALGAFAVLTAVATAPLPAHAKIFDRGSFHDVFTSDPYDCDGTLAVDHEDVRGNFSGVVRGSSPFPHFREHAMGRFVTTNLETGGTFTQLFTFNSRDHRITDNGDGTITIEGLSSGGSRFYDMHGRLVLKDPGMIKVAFDVDYNDTPGNPDDDTFVEGSFRVIKPSTGNSDFSTRNFCDDLRTFTTP